MGLARLTDKAPFDSSGRILVPTAVLNARTNLLTCLAETGRVIESQRDEALKAHGLSTAKLGALRELIEAGEPLALGQLAERLTCVKSNVTQLIDRLQQDGLVERVPDVKDRRRLRAVVTAQGRERYVLGNKAERAVEHRILGNLSTEECGQLRLLVEKLGGQ
jgi:DNA-binding MarR family transcriptional regulator